VTKVNPSEWKDRACEDAVKLELSQFFDELKALRIIKRVVIKKGAKVIKSHIVLVHKYLADGTVDKVKAWLVADGRGQDLVLYLNKPSPTVAIHSVYTLLGLAATKSWQIVVITDIKGALVQTPMKGKPTLC
jgi:hypothetical protein